MRFVLLALRRPVTVVIALIAVALSAVLALQRMPMDIFPQIDIPVVSVIWQYTGLNTPEM